MKKDAGFSNTIRKQFPISTTELYHRSSRLYAQEAELYRRSAELHKKEAEIHQRSRQLYAKEAAIYSKSANPQAVIEEITAKIETIHALEQRIQYLEHDKIALTNQVQAIFNTFSWRITAPLRVLRNHSMFLSVALFFKRSLKMATGREVPATEQRRIRPGKTSVSEGNTIASMLPH